MFEKINVPQKVPNVEMALNCQVDQMPYYEMPWPVLTHSLTNNVALVKEREIMYKCNYIGFPSPRLKCLPALLVPDIQGVETKLSPQ